MTNDWIIDVLMDLRKFSEKNQMDDLAEHLDDTIMVATAELAPPVAIGRRLAGDFEQARGYANGVGAGKNA